MGPLRDYVEMLLNERNDLMMTYEDAYRKARELLAESFSDHLPQDQEALADKLFNSQFGAV